MSKKYIAWLHQITVAGYDRGIILEAVHKDVLDYYYLSKFPISKALDMYIDFRIRWNAIRNDQGYGVNPNITLDNSQ